MQINLQLTRKPTGKISQLPPDIIDYVNQAIYAGVQYDEIIRQLAARGHSGFNKNNLSRWRRSGHSQWLIAQDRRDTMRIQSEAALDAARELSDVNKDELTSLSDKLVAIQLAETLWAFQQSKPALTNKPENFFKIARLASDSARETTRRKMIALNIEKLRDSRASENDVVSSGADGRGQEANHS